MMDELLLIFVKNPFPGFVKQRLAAEIGDREALRVYRAVTEKVLSAVEPERNEKKWAMAVAHWPPDAGGSIRCWLGSGLRLFPQRGNDLGERMKNAFQAGFSDGYQKIIVIGSDCPALTAEHIADGFALLGSRDAVFGPAADGGYYLIGLTRQAPCLFNGISWSTERVLSQSIDKCRNAHLTWDLLEELRDIDTADDLHRCRSEGVIT